MNVLIKVSAYLNAIEYLNNIIQIGYYFFGFLEGLAMDFTTILMLKSRSLS